ADLTSGAPAAPGLGPGHPRHGRLRSDRRSSWRASTARTLAPMSDDVTRVPAHSFEFDLATAVRDRGDGRTFDLDVDAGWTVGPKPNGGYLLAAAARAAGVAVQAAGADHPHPLAATAHYLRAPDAGPAEIVVDVLRLGRGASQARATLSQ